MLKIKTDSRKVQPGDTFVALTGYNQDGHDYIEAAIKNGAIKVVCEHGTYEVSTLLVTDTKKWLQDYLVKNYSSIINQLDIIGVTGTNGKTTTCFLTWEELTKLGVNACYIGTIGYYSKDEHRELPNTTPAILDIYTILLDALEKGITTAVMEVSSHALDLERVAGIKFKTVAFTNLTEDHLDYHKTMDEYLKAKLKILNYLRPDGRIVINNDDAYGKFFKQRGAFSTLGFTVGSDFQIKSFTEDIDGTTIDFSSDGFSLTARTNLHAKFNVYNYLTSVMLLQNLGFALEDILSVSKKVYAPKGRCETVSFNGGTIVIDYAHTPDAVEKIISTFKNMKRVITVIGCGGDRDPFKRPIMGSIASAHSDHVIFTSDNPRTESQEKIIGDILSGVLSDNYEIENDRVKAIRKGIDLLGEGDALLILGKGHEDYQIIGHTKHHLDDAEEVKKYISSKSIKKDKDKRITLS